MKRLLLFVGLFLLVIGLVACGGEGEQTEDDPPETGLGSGGWHPNVEVGTVSVKYLTQNNYNAGDFTEDKLLAEPSFSREEPYCYMVVDFTYRAPEQRNGDTFDVEFFIPERGFLGMRLEQAATAKFQDRVDSTGAELSLSMSVPQATEGEKSERVILRLAPIAVGKLTLKLFVDGYAKYTKELTVVDSCSLFSFELNEDSRSYTLTRFHSDYVSDVDIPRTLADGMPVTAIGPGAFAGRIKLQKISIPDSVKEIGAEAFSECYALAAVKLASVTNIAGKAFFKCSLLSSVEMPKAEKIGQSAFSYCENLTSLEMPFVTSVGYAAFHGCEALQTVNAPLLTSIGDIAFAGCPKLTSITLSSAKEIGVEAFYGCDALGEVDLSAATHIGKMAFYNCDKITALDLSSAVEIGAEAFSGCDGLVRVSISSVIENMGGGSFAKCPNLQYTHYEGIKYLGNTENPYLAMISVLDKEFATYTVNGRTELLANGCFSKCTAMASLTLPASVKRIGEEVFNGCTALVSIELPDALEVIGKKAFSGCAGLKTLDIPASVTEIGTAVFLHCTALEELTLPFLGGLLALFHYGEYLSNGALYEEGEIPESLKSVTVRSGDIASNAFSGCYSLASVTVLSEYGEIGDKAFYSCRNLTSLTLPATLQRIGKDAFCKCESLQEITFLGTEYQWGDISRGWGWSEDTQLSQIICSDGVITLNQ